MKLITTGLLSAILVAGLAGSVAAYRSQTGQDVSVEQPSAGQSPLPLTAETPRPRIRWAPCDEGSRLEKGVCVDRRAPHGRGARPARAGRPGAGHSSCGTTTLRRRRRCGDAVDATSGDDDRHADEDHGEDEDD